MAYLLFGMPGNHHTHFSPSSSLFATNEEKRQVTETLLWYATWIVILSFLSTQITFAIVLKFYLIPVLVFGSYISIVTNLHHTHPDLPWYKNEEWNFLRGNLSTIDRDYGVFEHYHHDIGTHVVHHLFMKIPHYHLREATAAIKPILGKYHRVSESALPEAIVRLWKFCRFVPINQPIAWFEGIKSAGWF